MSPQVVALALITLLASTVNGALGYGFSVITVPLALLFLSNRVLNPALVLVEVVLNAYVLWVNRASLPQVWRRVTPMIVGLAPGIVVGTLILARVNPGWLRFYTFVALLPLILLQAAGYRRPIQSERAAGLVFGGGLGVLYSVTTISGPPLAILFNNQGLVKDEFRAGLALVRAVESSVTAIVYYHLGLFVSESVPLLPAFATAMLIGIPLGAYAIRHLDAETFRRICMSFDAWIVGFGLSRVLIELQLVSSPEAYGFMAATIVIDVYLLYLFFMRRAAARRRPLDDAIGPWTSPRDSC